MQSYFTFPSLITLLACLLAGVSYAWILYGKTNIFSRKMRYLLAAGRSLAVALIIWLIFSPLVKTITYTLEKPIIVLAHDNSLSVSEIKARGFNPETYKKDMLKLSTQLSEKYEVRSYSFSDSISNGLNFTNRGKYTNAAAFSERIADELQNRNIGAVIIASDGIFNRGGSPVYELSKLRAPVLSIALGDTIPRRDVLISNVSYNDLVYADNDFTIETEIQAFQSKGAKTRLTVAEGSRTVYQQNIEVTTGLFVINIPVKLTAGSPGVKKYTVSVSGVENEITSRNNTQTIFVEVVDGKQDVLIAANSPHPDIAVLKQAVELNKHYKATVALADDLGALDLDKFGSVILYQLPAQQNLASPFFQKIKAGKASLWYILGAQSNPGAFNTVQTGVQLSGYSGSLQEVFPLREKSFTPFTLEGLEKNLQGMDPLIMPFGRIGINGNSSPLFNQRIGQVQTTTPLFFFMNENNRKVAYLLGEGLWRWKLNEGQNDVQASFVDELVSKTIQYLSVKEDKRKFRAFPAKNTFEENENIVLNANLYNESFVPVNTPDVALKIKNEAGKIFNYTFSRTDIAYRLDAGSFPKGNYTFEAIVNYGGKFLTSGGAFYVNEIIAEFQQTTANHQLLRSLAGQTQGKVYPWSAIGDIARDLEKGGKVKTISYEDRRFESLINLKWLFGFILMLLTAEWFIRKRAGQI